MAFLSAAVVDGATTKAEQIRRITNMAARGETSILRGTDLRVVPTATASSSVVIMPGSVAISAESTYGGPQSYLVAVSAAKTVAVPANTSSSSRTLFVIIAVRDPQYAGMPIPANPSSDLYYDVLVQSTVPTDRPTAVLATITQPASTATVTAGMIDTMVRPFALAREESDGEMKFPTADVYMSKNSYVSWPLSGFSVPVPKWANALRVEIAVNGVEYTGTDVGVGYVRCVFDDVQAQGGVIGTTGRSRQSINVMGKFNVRADQRGTNVYIGLQGYQTVGAGGFTVDSASQLSYRWIFQEKLQ